MTPFPPSQPEAIRVLLTGHADKASAILAINQVGLFQYLEKPWDNTQLLLVIQQAVERAQLLRELRRTIMQLDTANAALKGAQAHLLSAFLMKARLPKALRAGGLRRRCARSRSGRGYFVSR